MRYRNLVSLIFVGSAVSGALAQTGLPGLPVPAPQLPAITSKTVMERLDKSAVQWRITGNCRRLVPRVVMWVPVAYIETTPKAGVSILSDVASMGQTPSISTVVAQATGAGGAQGGKLLENYSETHVYQITDRMVESAGLGPRNMVCLPSHGFSMDPVVKSGLASLLDTSLCSSSVSQMQAIVGGFASESVQRAKMQSCTPVSVFSSESDPINWRGGCGDATIGNMLRSNAFTCSAQSVASAISSSAGTTVGAFIGEDACIDEWGPMFPRQGREIGNLPAVGSAKTAYRAMSYARKPLGSFLQSVTLDAKFQQVYPEASKTMPIGKLPGAVSQNALAKSSPNGAYGWVYWRQLSCCVPTGQPGGC